MPKHFAPSLPTSKYTVAQRDALEAIEEALRSRRIDFSTAIHLSDCVKAGREREVMQALNETADSKVKLTDLLDYSDEPN